MARDNYRCYLCHHFKARHLTSVEDLQAADVNPRVYHNFPTANEIRSSWLKICGLDENIDKISKNLLICSKHFTTDDYVNIRARQFGGKIRLKSDSVPKLLVPNCAYKAGEEIVPWENVILPYAVLADESEQKAITKTNSLETSHWTDANQSVEEFIEDASLNVAEVTVEQIEGTRTDQLITNLISNDIEDVNELIAEEPVDSLIADGTSAAIVWEPTSPNHVDHLSYQDVKTPRPAYPLGYARATIRKKTLEIQRLQQQNRRYKASIKKLNSTLQFLLSTAAQDVGHNQNNQ